MDLAQFSGVLASLVTIFTSFYVIRRLRGFQSPGELLNQYILPGEEEGTYKLHPKLHAALQAIGQAMFQSAKFSGLQALSAQARLEKGLKKAFAQDIIDNKMPILNLLGDFLGFNVKKYIAKNPDAFLQLLATPAIQTFISNLTSGSQNPASNIYNPGGQPWWQRNQP